MDRRVGVSNGVTWGPAPGGGGTAVEVPWEEIEPYDPEDCAVGESWDWQDLSGVGFEPPVEHDPGAVLGDPEGMLRRVLADLGYDQGDTAALATGICTGAVHAGVLPAPAQDREAVAGVGSLAVLRCRMEAVQLVAVQDLALRTGQRLLADKGVDDPSGLSATAWGKWRARAKALVAAELEVALGVGRGEARDMVAVACSPATVRQPVLGALRRGEAPWHLVRRFWTRAGGLAVEDVGLVAAVLFGTDVAVAAPERLDPDGHLHGRPWAVKEFYAAVDREVVRVKGKDERSARVARDEAVAGRDAWIRVHDDGTATLSISTPLITGVGVFSRVDRMARVLRKAGEARSLAQLRADLCAALLLHGAVAIPEVVDELVSPEDLATLEAVTTATPPVALQVVVPWDALSGSVVCPRCAHATPGHPPGGSSTPGRGASSEGWPVAGQAPLPGVGWSGTVAELVGVHPAFLTPGEARALALAPGTVLHRVLVDPADGRCIERTIAAYRPDADMRRQITAADVYGRGPGERTPPERWEIDHEHEHRDGGATRETNLNGKGVFFHAVKTARLWASVMNERRDVTWTTLLGQVVTTRGHDYRQYLHRVDALAPLDADPDRPAPADRPDLADRRDLASQVLYAAIVHRHAGAPARASDDVVDAEVYDLRLAGWASIDPLLARARGDRGAELRGPTPEQLLGMDAPRTTGRGTGWVAPLAAERDDPPPF